MEFIEGLIQLAFVIMSIVAIINGDSEAAHFGIIMALLLGISGQITDIKHEVENIKVKENSRRAIELLLRMDKASKEKHKKSNSEKTQK